MGEYIIGAINLYLDFLNLFLMLLQLLTGAQTRIEAAWPSPPSRVSHLACARPPVVRARRGACMCVTKGNGQPVSLPCPPPCLSRCAARLTKATPVSRVALCVYVVPST